MERWPLKRGSVSGGLSVMLQLIDTDNVLLMIDLWLALHNSSSGQERLLPVDQRILSV